MTDQLPLDTACPRCGAAIGRPCIDGKGQRTETHAGRWQAVGVVKPSPADRNRDRVDYKRRWRSLVTAAYADRRK